MIHWAWLIAAFYGGVVAATILLCLLVAGKSEEGAS